MMRVTTYTNPPHPLTQLWQVVLDMCTGEMQLRFTDPTTTTN